MDKLTLSKTQSKAIAQVIYADVKGYCLKNYERYFPWMLDDIQKSKGLPPYPVIEVNANLCLFCEHNPNNRNYY